MLASAQWSLEDGAAAGGTAAGSSDSSCTGLPACVACLRRPEELVAVRQAELCIALVQFIADTVVSSCCSGGGCGRGGGGRTASSPCTGCGAVQEESIKRQAELCTAALQLGQGADAQHDGSQEAATKLFQAWLVSAQKLNPMLAIRLMATMRS